jgi:hypothetical protein
VRGVVAAPSLYVMYFASVMILAVLSFRLSELNFADQSLLLSTAFPLMSKYLVLESKILSLSLNKTIV